MKPHHFLLSPLRALRSRYRRMLDQVEVDLETKSIGLPSAAGWTKRMTQIILIGITASVGWSVLARVDVVINASGKLEPLSQSQVIQSRVGGTVTAVLVREGDVVKQGQLLMQLDKTALYNQMQALLVQREQLVNETAVLRMAHQGKPMEALHKSKAKIPPELMNRVQTRLLLVAQITGDPSHLSPEQRQRFELFQRQLQDLRSLSRLQETNIQSQIAEAEAQLAQTGFQLQTEQELLGRLTPLAEQGAISRVNLLQRRVSVSELQKQMIQNSLQKHQLQVNQLRTKVEEGKLLNETQQDLQRRLAELDTEFDATIKQNQRQLVLVASQLNQVKLDLKNQDLKAPVDGVVFNLGPKLPGVVAQAGQTLLQIVPDESLTARVQVANADIANIRVGMPVDVRIDAYPFTEYGSIKGVVSKVGSEAVKISETTPGPTVFPVEVRLDRQFLDRKSERFSITPGMSVVAMIKVRQRAPISYVTEEITKAFDGIKSVR
ncbi:HlyD family type I secretion periplasmic adaptor subunit [Leptothermofonsia sichuanensis E412]|uniref:HlyD family type I secretion periplasmic adaptor subunit n=1 Tax=Leptothermofonsia sichuanensis TaxID=2917832 RepID=UPI001CA7726B|nr:HlyD family type I secretion periplasmic adaptor subunit [Leptothermofonsia sichuanensis]QZZ19249.1 HlyD family type I secretion periplasmic adaptor subunit [Leptothermofonsia sichuanensis E412]